MQTAIKLIFVLAVLTGFANLSNLYSQSGGQKPRKQKNEPNNALRKFISEDVPYIITESEKRAFEMLKTDEERENFIDYFWYLRDPNPDTIGNEFREEYYERIAYANEKFTSGIPGWRTDRGRIYITFGKPDSIESHPSGGSYERPSYEGGGSTTTYPFEIWFYRHLEGVGDGLELEFVDPTGTGEYRLARDANEKDALKMVPGAGQTLREMLGIETRGDRLTGQNAGYQREQDSPFRRLEIQRGLMTPPQVDRNGGMSNNPGPTLDNDPLDFDVRIDYFRRTDESVVATLSIQAPNDQLTYKDLGGIQTAAINISGKVLQVSGKPAANFQDVVTTSATTEELLTVSDRSSIYQKTIVLAPGIYKTEIKVRDIDSGKTGDRRIGFVVPKYDPGKLSTSTLVLASKLQQTNEDDIGAMFVIGDKKVVPNLSRKYKQGQEVGLYLQIYNSGIDQTTLRPSIDVEYDLARIGGETRRIREDWTGMSESGQRLILARFIDTDRLVPGEYKITIKIKDTVTGQSLEPVEQFFVIQ